MRQDDRPRPWGADVKVEIVGVPACAGRSERGVGEVEVIVDVVGLVPKSELLERPKRDETPPHGPVNERDVREPVDRLTEEEVPVVVAVAVALGRPVGGRAIDAEPGGAQPIKLLAETCASVAAEDALPGDEVVVPADLVALGLNPLERRHERVMTPVFGCIEYEVRCAQSALVLEAREVGRSIEALVHIVP